MTSVIIKFDSGLGKEIGARYHVIPTGDIVEDEVEQKLGWMSCRVTG